MAETANSSLISSSILKRRVILAILAVILQWSKSVWAQGATIETMTLEYDIKSKYLSGIYAIYNHTNLPVLPIALNSGKYWRKGYLDGPGCIEVSLLVSISTW